MKKDPSDPVWKRIAEMSVEEKEKCNDLLYYYNNYIRRKNDPILNKEEFEKLQYHWGLIRAGKMIAKPRQKNVSDYPLTNNEIFKNDKN